ncbi:hypothetical protein [Thioclava atlantica]|uniref:Uncharacterized protein n=1 Tax=Thioclava atlantica TaxID=1317124 RepID=A0A085U1F0_9RHOB|nr:hypothetical protein [Thioclava atlantica]KFE36797.1 hypothetical protein DW2_01525 [Thioclava atlantica]
MARHIIDQPRPKAEGARVKRFLDLQRREGVHPAIKELSKRDRGASRTKVTQFLRIERSEGS